MTKAEIEEELKTLEAENEKLKLAKKSKADSNRELAEELKLLEAENETLKKELADKRRNSSTRSEYSNRYTREEIADSVSDTNRTIADETGRILRGMTLSFFEPFRVYAEAVSVFADQIATGNQSQNYNSAKDSTTKDSTAKNSSTRERSQQEDTDAYIDRSMSFTGDVFTGMAKSLNKIAEIPGRTIDRFYDGYKEGSEYTSKKR